ncbi:MAG: thioredoxin [Verrucomicrobiia bacterium]
MNSGNVNMKKVKEINSTEFVKEVLNSDVPVVVDFYTPWCGPCKMLAPVLERVAGEYDGKVKFVKVNVDDAPALAATYNISGVPTIILFKDGRIADISVGFVSEGMLRSTINRVIENEEENESSCGSGGCCCGW